MSKYYLVAKNTWDEILSYRINFALWRLRNMFGMLVGYFLWTSVMPENGVLFGYSRDLMISYILLAPLLSSIVFSTRTQEIGENINSGDLSFFLLKPIGYFKYWFFRDFGDKAMNFCFCLVEFSIFVLIFRPAIFIQTNAFYLTIFLLSLVLAIVLHFFISTLLSMIAFWSPEVWAPRFIFYVVLAFFAGSYFPLDILPKPVFNVLTTMPFGYLQYFPLKIYLGQLSIEEMIRGFLVTIAWIGLSYGAVLLVWNKGLKLFSAAGR